MSGYTSGFSAEEYDDFRDVLRDLGQQQGTFDANDATAAILSKRLSERGPDQVLANAGDILTVLQDMADLGYIRSIDRDPAGGPARWEYVE